MDLSVSSAKRSRQDTSKEDSQRTVSEPSVFSEKRALDFSSSLCSPSSKENSDVSLSLVSLLQLGVPLNVLALSLLQQQLLFPPLQLNLSQNEEASSKESFVINPVTGNRCRSSYKNTTVEKRTEANARERSRVQTMAAVFESLREKLPCKEPKLSKLAILRIACKYILYLGALVGEDLSEGGQAYSEEDCRLMLVETMEQETKTLRR